LGTLIKICLTTTPKIVTILIIFFSFEQLYLMYQDKYSLLNDNEFIKFDSYIVPKSDLYITIYDNGYTAGNWFNLDFLKFPLMDCYTDKSPSFDISPDIIHFNIPDKDISKQEATDKFPGWAPIINDPHFHGIIGRIVEQGHVKIVEVTPNGMVRINYMCKDSPSEERRMVVRSEYECQKNLHYNLVHSPNLRVNGHLNHKRIAEVKQ
jgi:hypothetical protein